MKTRIIKKEKGIITILVLMMISFASMAVFLSSSSSLKSSQNSSITTHQTVLTQSRAWTGVEAVRQILLNLDTTTISAFKANDLIDTGISGLKAIVVSNDPTNKQIIVNVSSCSNVNNNVCVSNGNFAGSTTTIQAAYTYVTSPQNNSSINNVVIDMAGNITFQGNVVMNGGTNKAIVIDGNITSTTGFKGVDTVYTTGSVNIAGGGMSSNSTLSAEGDITLSGSGNYGVIKSLGNVSMSGGTSANTLISSIYANGKVNLANASVDSVTSIGDITVSNGGTTVNTASTLGNINITAAGGIIKNSFANGNVTQVAGSNSNISAMGNVTVTQGTFNTINANGTYTGINGPAITSLNVIGNITQTNGSITSSKTKSNHYQTGTSTSYGLVQGNFFEYAWGSFMDGLVGISINKTQTFNTNVRGTVQSGLTVNINPVAALSIPPLTKTTVQKTTVDANLFRSSANYIFSYTNSNMMVTVTNVNGIPNGTYFLYQGWIGGQPYYDYVCTTATPTKASDCLKKIGIGWSIYNQMISYNASTSTWKIEGTSIAPGIAFFEGTLNVSTGTFYNTFLATRNIITNNQNKIYAVNYTGYANVCANSAYPNLYPTQLCDVANTKYISPSLGNIVLLAGSYTNNIFYGGDISLGNQTQAFGNIVAGNLLNTSGDITLYGFVTVSKQNKNNTGLGLTASGLGGSTIINLNNLPSTYDPSASALTTGSSSNSNTSSSTTIANCYIRKARYI